MKKKIIVVAVIVALAACIAAGVGGYWWYENVKVPHDNAVEQYELLSDEVNAINEAYDQVIAEAQAVLDAGEKPLDEGKITELQVAISAARDDRKELPAIPEGTEEILSVIDQYEGKVDYEASISALNDARKALEDSITRQKQITAPSEEFVVDRLARLEGISGIQAASEDLDPNGQFGKAGGYTAAVYFASDSVNQSEVYNDGEYGYGAVGQGTDGGGCVEVYATEEDAQKRNDYLASYDGTVLASGSHNVYGTVLVRTSDLLKASEQKELETKIYESLIALDEA
ncbi:hypothetical protein [uncultured Adlercreutzia sp.]|uniref:hypothetical protein n=1 Tax=uncultured Adlercreutzia sp. TaxID=875803 RepID=UPI0026F3AEAA|nr:hypothetical protein [uncultured Adlercreutzia sp.]